MGAFRPSKAAPIILMATWGAKNLYGGAILWKKKKIIAGFAWTIRGTFCGLSLAILAGGKCVKYITKKEYSSNNSSRSITVFIFFTLVGLGSVLAHISIILIPGSILYIFRDLLTPVWVMLSLIGLGIIVGDFTDGRNKVVIKIFGDKAERRLNGHLDSNSSEPDPPIDFKDYFERTPVEITRSAIDNVLGTPNTSNRQENTKKKQRCSRTRHLSTDEANKKLEQIKLELEEEN